MFELITKQTYAELVMFFFFLVMTIYMVIIFSLKNKDQNILIRKRVLFQAITFLITMIFIMISCLVSDMMQPVFVYQIAIAITGLIIYTLCINNWNISKVAGIEFSESSETYKQLISYSKLADDISAYMTDFCNNITPGVISYLRSCHKEESFMIAWTYAIDLFIKERGLKLVNAYINLTDEVMKNYITDIVNRKKLWYNSNEIKDFVNDVKNNKVVKLQTTLNLVPIDNVLFYIESDHNIEKLDVEFIINTYKLLKVLAK